MEIKKIESVKVLKYSTKATLKDLASYTGVVPTELMTTVAEQGIEVAGSQIWQYTGSDGNPDTTFLLEICVPIKEFKGDSGKFEFGVLPEIKCLSVIHKGSWSKMGATYGEMMAEIAQKKMSISGICREIYTHCDFENEANCVTEIEIAIQ